jgi:RNA polymerase sigma-70 factor (ECF subfamily)
LSSHSSHTDTDLLNQLEQGDRKAFESIYHRYASDLFRYARRIIPQEDAEELIQDVFEWLWVKRGGLNITSLRHYLFTAVRNRIIRYIEHQRVRKKYEEHFRLFEEVYDNIPESGRNAEAIRERILKSIEDLPERCQAAFRLRLLENLSGDEIAARMNIAKRTVENYMVMAHQHLRLSYGKIFKDIG